MEAEPWPTGSRENLSPAESGRSLAELIESPADEACVMLEPSESETASVKVDVENDNDKTSIASIFASLPMSLLNGLPAANMDDVDTTEQTKVTTNGSLDKPSTPREEEDAKTNEHVSTLQQEEGPDGACPINQPHVAFMETLESEASAEMASASLDVGAEITAAPLDVAVVSLEAEGAVNTSPLGLTIAPSTDASADIPERRDSPVVMNPSEMAAPELDEVGMCVHGIAHDGASPGHIVMPPESYLGEFQDMLPFLDGCAPSDLATSDAVYNRELSELDFFWRVLYEALDPSSPLLERVKFVAITAGNVDGYVCKRMGKLRIQAASMRPEDRAQYLRVVDTLKRMNAQMVHTLTESILPNLVDHSLEILTMGQLDITEQAQLQRHFQRGMQPLLSPMAVDARHPFPVVNNLAVNVACIVMDRGKDRSKDRSRFVVIRVPPTLGRWVRVNTRPNAFSFVAVENVVMHFLPLLFPKQHVVTASVFRASRDCFLEDDGKDPEDVLDGVQVSTAKRRVNRVVRIEVHENIKLAVLDMLLHHMGLQDTDVQVVEMGAFVGLADLMFFCKLPLEHLQYQAWHPKDHPATEGVRMKSGKVTAEGAERFFSIVRRQDVYVQFPYHSFTSTTLLFLEASACDRSVLSIKMTWYRSANNTLVRDALIKAVKSGKEVTVIIELKASFDEEKNIQYAQDLEDAGCTVTYGLEGMKTHAKILLAVRAEAGAARAYALVGTGNFNSDTAALYIDTAIITSHAEITEDCIGTFNFLTSYARRKFKKLLVSPLTMQTGFRKMIDAEARRAREGKPAHIIARVNGLTDQVICKALYEASADGVRIDLLVRGMCRIRPGLKQSPNITVMSYVGRFLEHARMYYFYNDGQPKFFLGSADWMSRNLRHRVEVIVPVLDVDIQQCMYNELMMYLRDEDGQAWFMTPDGRYCRTRKNADDGGVWAKMMESVKSADREMRTGHLHRHIPQRYTKDKKSA